MTTSPLFKKLKTHTVVAICAATIGLFSSTSAMAADMSNGANNFYQSQQVTIQKVTFKINTIWILSAIWLFQKFE